MIKINCENVEKDKFKVIPKEEIARYYDMLYSWFRNYKLEGEFLHKFFFESYSKVNSLLDVGCGTGNHILALQPYGYPITGIDNNDEMLSIAKSKITIIPDIHLVNGDILNPPFIEKSFDATYALFSFVDNFYPFDNLLCFFSSIRKILKNQGILIVEVLNKKIYKKQYPKPRFYYLGKHKWKQNHISTCVYPYFGRDSLLHMNLFHLIKNSKTNNELKLKTQHILLMYDAKDLKTAGIRNSLYPVEVYGDFNFQPYNEEDSENVIIVFKKVGKK